MNFWENRVLFIDGEAIVIDKPAGLAVHPGARTPREPRRLSSPSSLRLPAPAAAGPPARPRHVGLPAARPQPQGAQALPAGLRGEEVEQDLCRGARRRAGGGGGTVDLALGKISTARRAGGWCPIRRGKPAVTALAGRRGPRRARADPASRRRPAAPTRSASTPPQGIGIPIAGDPVYGAGRGPMLLHALSLRVERDAQAAGRGDARRCRRPSSMRGSAMSDFELPEEALEERSSPRPGRAGRTSTRSRPPASCAATSSGSASRPTSMPRLKALAGSRMTAAGEIVITARKYRTQEANREDARARLAELIAQAHVKPVKRVRDPAEPRRQGEAGRQQEAARRGQAGAREGEAGLTVTGEAGSLDAGRSRSRPSPG